MSKNIKNIQFIQGVDFEFIQSLPNNGTKYLLIFDDSCEEISSSKEFVKIATAGRHKGLSTIYITNFVPLPAPITITSSLQSA